MSSSLLTLVWVVPILLIIKSASSNKTSADSKSPHIIFIVADDLGWNDVGFHGLDEIPTPNIDALAYSGTILKNYYTAQLCTPSRSAIMTGKHPIHTGLQHNVLYGCERGGLNLSEKILPQYLKELGYRTRMVGKWHLGFFEKEYTPTYRGFESHLGFWTGHQDYFDHSAEERVKTPHWWWGLDMRRDMEPAWDLHGKYSTDIWTEEAVDIIQNHSREEPLFLYLAHTATHSANNYDPLQAPDQILSQHKQIENYQRSKFAGMLHKLDESVGKVVDALYKANMLANSIIVFVSDNGGAAAGFNSNAASNWPLRGVKNTLFEGGVRASAFLWSPLLESRGIVANQFFHVADWLPTLVSAAKNRTFTDCPNSDQNLTYNKRSGSEVDGLDTWEILSQNKPGIRDTILHNIDDIWHLAALTKGKWKILKGHTYNGTWDFWFGPSGRHGSDNTTKPYNPYLVINSTAGKAIQNIGYQFDIPTMLQLRENATVSCGDVPEVLCQPQISPCLFDISIDPCEKNNLADSFPDILNELEKALAEINGTAVKPIDKPCDLSSNPDNFNHTWSNFGDKEWY
uniref:Arylsulfatase B n=1 Tax=Cacopsylla melanoneura TaxID=428564 RepID=A0A8D8TXT8_9HEMI